MLKCFIEFNNHGMVQIWEDLNLVAHDFLVLCSFVTDLLYGPALWWILLLWAFARTRLIWWKWRCQSILVVNVAEVFLLSSLKYLAKTPFSETLNDEKSYLTVEFVVLFNLAHVVVYEDLLGDHELRISFILWLHRF